jgi:phospholipase/carboxylesterase
MHVLGIGESRAPGILPPRDARLYVPTSAPAGTALPLLVLLHGATGSGADWFGSYGQRAETHRFAMLAPDSRDITWDLFDRGFGADVRFIDRALAWTFDRVRIDPQRIALAGFSDGGSYALSLGLSNGDLFSRIVAYSPCILEPGKLRGKPRIYVAHGTADTVLPIASCSRRVVPELRGQGYMIEYREFTGGHEVPSDVSATALTWLAGSWTSGG